MIYQPPKKILQRYADVLINFALGGGKGIKKGETVRLIADVHAKPLFLEMYKAIIIAGGNVLPAYRPTPETAYRPSHDVYDNLDMIFFKHASKQQLAFFPKKFLKGLIDEIDHHAYILSHENPHAAAHIDPKQFSLRAATTKPYFQWRTEKELKGKLTWLLAMYPTPGLAKEAGMSLRAYWDQVIKACFLDKKDPIAHWKKTARTIDRYKKKLTTLPIEKLHVTGRDVDLWITLGEKRQWLGGGGRNIPSFEIFTSPDRRYTQGWIRFNVPLYYGGKMISGIELEFKNGRVTRAKAKKNLHALKAMIAKEGADMVGEFSLTDKRLSRITRFMADTLFDENVGGPNGNTHIALGKSYIDAYHGDASRLSKARIKALGFNDSAVHTDIISTTPRTVTAHLKNGKTKVIYTNGMFTV